jgi:hypothetical protein
VSSASCSITDRLLGALASSGAGVSLRSSSFFAPFFTAAFFFKAAAIAA